MSNEISAEEYLILVGTNEPTKVPTSKYGAQPTVVDGIRFASKAEARRYEELKLRERVGEISDLTLQPRYPLVVNGEKVGTYVGDFRYTEAATQQETVEDVKGVATPVYRLKKKLVRAIYGVDILEVK